MLFNSDIFLFVFLPLTLLAFYTLGSLGRIRLSIAALVLASLIYYAWWNPVYVPLILGSMLTNYFVGIAIQRRREKGTLAKPVLVGGIIFNLGLLGYFKYANFFVDSLNSVSGSGIELAPIILPLAISFFTFQQIAFIIDAYQGKAREVDLLRYALFVTFFPQLIAGPIVHHKEMMPQFAGKAIGRFLLANLVTGGMIFFLGLFKKVVIADNVAPFATELFNAGAVGQTIDFARAWTGVLAYTVQIYFDFSGYSDMAIGLARMFGIVLPLNFDSPYKATGIIDFWRRWHMTLSRFLRDYLYIPLGGNRLGMPRRYVNMMIVMLLGGLWHGAGWNFVIWGGLHGLYLGINLRWRLWRGEAVSPGLLARACSRGLTFLAVVFAWVFFRAESLDAALSILASMTGFAGSLPANPSVLFGQIDKQAAALIAVSLSIAWFAPNTQQFMRDFINVDDAPRYRLDRVKSLMNWLRWRPRPVYAVALALLTAFTVMSLWQPSEFIYYQF
jgi:alginate O-acetyltransferase complex protein AlgI